MSDLLQPAQLRWNDTGEPSSDNFDDVYFSSECGLEETRYVFLKHNRLLETFQALKPNETLCIAETGFGTGLNFLAVWAAWAAKASKEAHLHFISIELYPLQYEDISRALARWPELKAFADMLLIQYPRVLYRGFHRLTLTPNIHLTLIFDEVKTGLSNLLPLQHAGPELTQTGMSWGGFQNANAVPKGWVNAWFLDGFAPAKNPEMWDEKVFELIAKLSRPGASFATFTSVGTVKRGLQSAGFNVSKTKGYGRKREMLYGIYSGDATRFVAMQANTDAKNTKKINHNPSWHIHTPKHARPKHIAVIGAGLAGAHTARKLAEKGFTVTVLESSNIASGASGNPKGVLYSTLSHQGGDFSDFNLASFAYALRHYQKYQLITSCGVLDLASTPKDYERYKQISERFAQSDPTFVRWVNAIEATQLSNLEIGTAALFFEDSGWLTPPEVCSHLLDHKSIQVQTNIKITELHPITEIEKSNRVSWQLVVENKTGLLEADAVVIATAEKMSDFAQTRHLPVKALRGQVNSFEATLNSKNLKAVLCGKGYICPANDKIDMLSLHEAGATFNLASQSLDISEQDTLDNLKQLHELSPDLHALSKTQHTRGRAAFRCTVPDYLPIVGPVPKHEAMIERFHAFRANAKTPIDAPGAYWPGLFVSTGYGSRGLTYTPMCAELLADQICNEAPCLPRDLALCVHPSRFIIRDLIKKRI